MIVSPEVPEEQILVLPVLPKLSGLGLSGIPSRLVSTITPDTTVCTKFSDLQLMILQLLVNVGDCFPSIRKNTHLLRIMSLARVLQVRLPIIGK